MLRWAMESTNNALQSALILAAYPIRNNKIQSSHNVKLTNGHLYGKIINFRGCSLEKQLEK